MKCKGSVTVFLALLLTCIFSGLFAFLEAARVSGLKASSQMCTMQAKDGLLASYHTLLWEKYRLLFWEGDFPDLSDAESLQQEIIAGNRGQKGMGQNYDVLSIALKKAEVREYLLATDHGGISFCKQAAKMMEQEVAKDALESVKDLLLSSQNGKTEAEAADRQKSALQVLEDLQNNHNEKTKDSAVADSKGNEDTVSVPDNPIQWMKDMKKKGILAVLMPDRDISVKKTDWSESVSKRKLQEGTSTIKYKVTVLEKVLFRLYLEDCFSNVLEEKEDGALEYEMEYLIGGKSSDKANLKAAVNRLLLSREAANLAFLETNPEKQQIALAAAAAITTAVGQPALTEPVKHGILAAWAYAESLSDVRILLDGGKVSIIKTGEQWHTQLDHLSAGIKSTAGENQQKGLSYTGYLQLLLWTMQDKKLSLRAMDLIEKDTGIRMDHMICRMECDYEYEAPALFWKFVRLGDHSFSDYLFHEQATLSYLDENK